PTRTARTAWNGTLEDGAGQVELTSSGLSTFDVSFPRRAADDAEGVTSPEELIAAAHSACFAMQLSAVIAEPAGTPVAREVSADVSLGPHPEAGSPLTGTARTDRGEVEGLDETACVASSHAAKETCPVSRALTGVEITLDAGLLTAD